MKIHDLKTWPEYFIYIHDGSKPFEIRINDKDYKVGDLLILREWDPETGEYTGRACARLVTYITDYEQRAGHIVMGLKFITN